ncbi:HupE/UreJ family protein [Paenibacillus sp. GCM10027626]|uniref:HupE/UreJ family protein n=1 Tax=Paenibacillus sp. GCM10027626 TaxID=3273411 RepID=UPI00362C5B2F
MLNRNRSGLKKAICLAALCVLLLFSFNSAANAHAYSSSYSTLTLTKEQTELSFAIDSLSALELAGEPLNTGNTLDQAQFERIKERLESVIQAKLRLKVDDADVSWLRLERFELNLAGSKGPKVELTALFPPVAASQSLAVVDELYLNDAATNYVNLLSVHYGGQTSSAALHGADRTWTMELTADDYAGLEQDSSSNAQAAGGWKSFFELGMHHILSGYDHLLFLFSLLIARQSFKQYAALITSFTIAHSLTLTLTVLDIIDVPGWIVEPAIALSICYVAIDNMIRKQMNYRWVITFLFGLIHGMGFADILKEMEIPRQNLAVNLISFNLGIEAVQLIIVALILPPLYWLNRWKYAKPVLMTGSAAAFMFGGIWFVQRVFFDS